MAGHPGRRVRRRGASAGPISELPNRYLEYYFMANTDSANYVDQNGVVHGHLRSARRTVEQPVWEDYAAIHNLTVRANPALNGGVGSWSDVDSTNGAIWLELTNKRGVIFSNFSGRQSVQNVNDCVNAAHEWYGNAGVNPPIGACSHGCAPAGSDRARSPRPRSPPSPSTTRTICSRFATASKMDYTVDPRSVIDLERTFGIRTAPLTILGAGK